MEPDIQITAELNRKNRQFVADNWNLGPEVVDANNGRYWTMMAKLWRVSPGQAQRQLCANCEYFDDTPDMLARMEVVPEDKFDKDGGGRGWCHKFDFICHNLRTCQAWEPAKFDLEED